MPPHRSPSPQDPANPSDDTASSPYPRNLANPSRTKGRLQFTACGACRMRRVKCDLKELNVETAGPNPACSNCKERNLKCIDEFSAGKPSRLLRRGRRIQKVEAIYGKDARDVDDPHRSHNIPRIQPQFFRSAFWKWFSLQHPILDAVELPARLAANDKGAYALSKEGLLLFMTIVVWAASYGVNEKGGSIRLQPTRRKSCPTMPDSPVKPEESEDALPLKSQNKQLKNRCNSMISELIELIDIYGVLRNPTWDGVRVLLLVGPLLDDETSVLQKLNIYEMAFTQARVLCTMTVPSPHDSIVRTHVFWYAQLEDSFKSGLRGRRLVFTEDDIEAFETPQSLNGNIQGQFKEDSSPPTVSGLPIANSLASTEPSQMPPPPLRPTNLVQSIPIRIGSICRRIHYVLLSPSSKRKSKFDVEGLLHIWDELEISWNDLSALLDRGTPVDEKEIDLKRFVAGWKCFLFECHNVIREALAQQAFGISQPPSPPTTSGGGAQQHFSYLPSVHDVHATSTSHCYRLLPAVMQIIKNQLTCDDSALFKFDCGRVREAISFAGYLIIEDTFNPVNKAPTSAEEMQRIDHSKDMVKCCLRAFQEMKWLFSKNEPRMENIRILWRERCERFASQTQMPQPSHHQEDVSLLSTPPNFFGGPPIDVPLLPTQHQPSSGPITHTPPQLNFDYYQGDNTFYYTSPPLHNDTYNSPQYPENPKWGPPGSYMEVDSNRPSTSGSTSEENGIHRATPYKPTLPPISVPPYFSSSAPNTASSASGSWAFSPQTVLSDSDSPSPTFPGHHDFAASQKLFTYHPTCGTQDDAGNTVTIGPQFDHHQSHHPLERHHDSSPGQYEMVISHSTAGSIQQHHQPHQNYHGPPMPHYVSQ